MAAEVRIRKELLDELLAGHDAKSVFEHDGLVDEHYDRALEYSRRALEVNPNMDGVRRNIELLERLLEQRRSRMI